MSELHHGEWWRKTWETDCTPNSNEILVPIILYMDGISLDVHGKLTLTPLNFTLGIFNTETRTKAEAWETIYFHPDQQFESSRQIKNALSIHCVKNLHRGIEAALESFHDVCEQGGIDWDYLPYFGKTWSVRMKFAIAYVVGDTELHDKLCGKYGSRTGTVKKICRHCDCPTDHIHLPEHQKDTNLYEPYMLDELVLAGPEACKAISHHPIINAFHRLNFGSHNPYNIHLATPGECLHMHQLGVAKRAIEAFTYLIMGKDKDESAPTSTRKTGSLAAIESIGNLGRLYGGYLSRQSDRDFPRTKFGKSILVPTKKEGHEYAGILIDLLLAIVSDRGREILIHKKQMNPNCILDQVQAIELILGMEEWMKTGNPTLEELQCLPPAIHYFIDVINEVCKCGGMGTKLQKNHLYFHLPKYKPLLQYLLFHLILTFHARLI